MARAGEVTIVSAQVPSSTRAELERRAAAGYRSLSGELRIAIDRHLASAAAAPESGAERLLAAPTPEGQRSAAPYWQLPIEKPRAPAWVLGDPDEWLAGRELRRFHTPVERFRFDTSVGVNPVIEGRMMPYLEWTTINSPSEGGAFLERFLPGSFREQIRAGIGRVQLLFDHGIDGQFGRMPLGRITSLRDLPDGAYFRATLLDGIPELLISGLRAGLFGSSVRFSPVQVHRERYPQRSEWNPRRLPEQSVVEAELREVSITPFAAYAGATAEIVEATA